MQLHDYPQFFITPDNDIDSTKATTFSMQETYKTAVSEVPFHSIYMLGLLIGARPAWLYDNSGDPLEPVPEC